MYMLEYGIKRLLIKMMFLASLYWEDGKNICMHSRADLINHLQKTNNI